MCWPSRPGLQQIFVIDGETKVGKVLDRAGTELGTTVKATGFCRYQLGEGIERGPDDFAGEVAAQLGQ